VASDTPLNTRHPFTRVLLHKPLVSQKMSGLWCYHRGDEQITTMSSATIMLDKVTIALTSKQFIEAFRQLPFERRRRSRRSWSRHPQQSSLYTLCRELTSYQFHTPKEEQTTFHVERI
jgi:hypothetical protein